MKNINWNNVQEASDYKTLPAGAYIAGIVAAEDVPEKEYLNIYWDVADGEFRGYFREMTKSMQERGKLESGKWAWGGIAKKSYKETALPYFKAFLTAVEQSNTGYKFNNDESTLRGKLVGVILGEEEYQANDGSIKTKLVVSKFTSVAKIREGDFEIPPKKLLNNSTIPAESFAPINDSDDLPF